MKWHAARARRLERVGLLEKAEYERYKAELHLMDHVCEEAKRQARKS